MPNNDGTKWNLHILSNSNYEGTFINCSNYRDILTTTLPKHEKQTILPSRTRSLHTTNATLEEGLSTPKIGVGLSDFCEYRHKITYIILKIRKILNADYCTNK